MLDIQAARKRCEAATKAGCPLCTIEIDGNGNATHEPGCALADLPAALDALEDLEHQRNEQFDRAEIADCRLADAQMALEEAQELNLQMMRLLQQTSAEGKATVAIYLWLRDIRSPPPGWVGDTAKYALAAWEKSA